MTPSKRCYDLIRENEGCELNAYPDPGSGNLPITIGWGSTMYTTGAKIKMGDTITQEFADKLLEWEVNNKATIIDARRFKLNQNQFDAIVSFCYNVGLGNFFNSTMYKRMKAGDYNVANEFAKWNKSNGKVLRGLTTRRAAEAKLFSSP